MQEPTDERPKPARSGLIGRLRSTTRLTRLLIATGGFLLVVLLVFDGCSGVKTDQESAVATARVALENAEGGFVPDHVDVRLIRQGFPPQPAWAVVLVIRDPEGGRLAYLRRAAITVDARTGEVLEVDIAGSG